MPERPPSTCDVYTLSEAWSGVNWADLMAAQGAFLSNKVLAGFSLHKPNTFYHYSKRRRYMV